MIKHIRQKVDWLRSRGVTIDDLRINKHAIWRLSCGDQKIQLTTSMSPNRPHRANIKFQTDVERWLRSAP